MTAATSSSCRRCSAPPCVLGLLGYAGNGLVRLLERRLTRWQHPA